MNARNFSLVLALVVFSTSRIFAQGQFDFFFSFESLGGPVVNGDASGDFEVVDTGSRYLYYTTNGPSDSDLTIGFFTDIFNSVSGVIAFTAAETFDYDLTISGIPVGPRWSTDNGTGIAGPAGSVTDDLVTGLRAKTISSFPHGIREANNGSGLFLDTGYSSAGDAFQLGRLDFDVIGNGTVDLNYLLTAVLNGPIDFTETAVAGRATIAVGIPVPASAGLLAFALIGLEAQRRRS